MSCDVEKSIFEDTINTVKHILNSELANLSDIKLLLHDIVIIFFNEVHLVFIGLGRC
jgi:hypothetical protein